MAGRKIKDPKVFVCALMFGICFVGSIILFIMGGSFFSQERPKVINYANSECLVRTSSYKTYRCKSRYSSYTCYGPVWDAYYGGNKTISALVEFNRRYSSYRDAINKANEYKVGSSYSCWYDTRHPTVAQWDKPSTTVPIILLCSGGLSIFLAVLFFFLGIRLVKKEIARENSIYSPSYPYSNYNTKS